jgi:hypothetical protein
MTAKGTTAPAFLAALVASVSLMATARMQRSIDGIDARAIWHEPAKVDATRCEGNDNDTRRQLACVVGIMKQSGAAEEAIAFTRRLAAQAREVGYISKLKEFGSVSLATVEWPFRRNTNAHSDIDFYILNGSPSLVGGSSGCADNDRSLVDSPDFKRLKRQHPDITTWEGTEFVGESILRGDGERFVFSCPLGESHADAGHWNAYFALDFNARGRLLGHTLLRISDTGTR